MIVTLQLSQTAEAMADIKLLVFCVAMVVVCLELQQGLAQGDVLSTMVKSYMISHKIVIKPAF